MVAFSETGNLIRSTISLAVTIQKGSLIDFETTGRPRRDGEHEVITVGYMEGDKVTITQRKAEEKTQFYEEVRHTLEGLSKPFFSYYADFEKSIFEMELGMSVRSDEFVDIMEPWKAKANDHGLKWPKLDELISEPEDYFEEHKISGKDVPAVWKRYLVTRDEKLVRSIMEHCLSDILREAILLIRYQN